MNELLYDRINMLIMDSMRSGDKVRTETVRAIKTAFINWKTDKTNVGKQLDYSVEVQILNKMIKMRMDAIDQFEEAGRQDLANNERAQIQVLKEFLPAMITKDQIEKAFEVVQRENGWELVKKNMGNYIKAIKVIYPSADGKLISNIVKERLQ